MKMLNKKREQKLKNQLSFAFRIRRIFLLIPLLLLCLSFVIPTQVHAQTDDSYFLNMWLNTKSLADLKNVYPGHTNIIVATISDPDLSKIPASKVSATSSNPSVLKVIDKYNIDFANQTYSVTESGQFINSETITRKSSNDYTIIRAYDTVMLPDDDGKAEFAKIQLLDATGTLYFIND